MNFYFADFNKAVEFTLEFYDIKRITDYILSETDKITPKEPITSNSTWHETVKHLHANMEEEILQNMVLLNDVGKTYYFGLLKDWLKDYRITKVHVPTLINAVETYNNKVYEDYLIRQEEKEKIFTSTEEYKKYKHHEVYQRKFKVVGKSGRDIEIDIDETYNRFIIAYTPRMINMEYLAQYIPILQDLITNFKRIVSFHLDKYEEIKAVSNKKIELPPPSVPKEFEQIITPETASRIKAKLTVSQLTFLFRLLKDCDLIQTKYDKQIHEFIADNFDTTGLGGKRISAKNIGRLWNTSDPDIINFWIAKFKELSDKAGKK